LVIYPLVLSERETLAAAHRGASLARYGDGELKLALDRDAKSQHGDQGLAKRLRQILAAPTGACLVCIPNIESKTPKAEFWAQYKADRYVRLYRGPRLAVGPAYGSSFITRPDSAPWIDRPEYWRRVVDLWRGQDVVLVRGSSKSLTAADLVDARSVDETIRLEATRLAGLSGAHDPAQRREEARFALSRRDRDGAGLRSCGRGRACARPRPYRHVSPEGRSLRAVQFPGMKVVADWHCPDLLSGPGNYLNKNKDAQHAFKHVKAWRTCVQAGGHIGTWPVMLAARFDRVITFEPELENFYCLVRNVAQRTKGNVFPVRGVLGHKRQPVPLKKSPKSTGQHRVATNGQGELIPTFRIDDLGLTQLDAIFLDVEGFEHSALLGAQNTINRWRPVIMAEENRRALDFGHKIGDLEALLREFGYRKVAAINEDLVFAPEPHP
jgi:FkbM family methyltransferase